MILESHDGSITVIDVALLAAVGVPRCDLSQVALSDRLTAQRTERLRPWCPAIHDDEFHVSPPIEKQKPDDTIVRPGWTVPSYRG
jgi:hypothetical protein